MKRGLSVSEDIEASISSKYPDQICNHPCQVTSVISKNTRVQYFKLVDFVGKGKKWANQSFEENKI